MPRLNFVFLLFGFATGALVLSGCGGGTPVLDTEPVTGVVTLDGEPVPEATVLFSPVNEGEGTPATGMTDSEGVYTLTARPAGGAKGEAGAGTTPGEYNVGVIKTESAEAMSAEEQHKQATQGDGGGSPEEQHEQAGQGDESNIVPEKYNSPKNSGITVTVTEGKNEIPIELSSN